MMKKLEIPENRPHIQSFCGHKDCHLICSEKITICNNEANIGTQTLDNKASFEDLHRHC